MRKILTILTALYPEYSVATTTLALGAAMLSEAIKHYELNDDETIVVDIYKDDIQIKKILKPKVFPRSGFKEIRRLDKLVGVRLYPRAVNWLLKILKYF